MRYKLERVSRSLDNFGWMATSWCALAHETCEVSQHARGDCNSNQWAVGAAEQGALQGMKSAKYSLLEILPNICIQGANFTTASVVGA